MESVSKVLEIANEFGLITDELPEHKFLARLQDSMSRSSEQEQALMMMNFNAALNRDKRHEVTEDEIKRNPYFFSDSSYEKFFVAMKLFEYGDDAFSPEQIASLPYSHIVHHLNEEEFLEPILKDGRLRVNAGGRTDQYPGIYANIKTHHHSFLSRSAAGMTHYEFILPLTMLRRKAWHYNADENYGVVNHDTYDYTTFPLWVMTNWNLLGQRPEELVFHNEISLNDVEILVVPKAELKSTRAMVKKYDVKLNVISHDFFVQKYRIQHKYKGMYTPMKSNPEPRFDYFAVNPNGASWIPDAVYMGHLQNTGHTYKESKDLMASLSRRELAKYVLEPRTGMGHKVVVHPPYT